jgi:Lar family restriction alleviation protein
MSVELKPCPFCGGEAEMVDARKLLVVSKYSYIIPYSVRCSNRKCGVKPYTEYSGTEQEAIDAWNRRAYD